MKVEADKDEGLGAAVLQAYVVVKELQMEEGVVLVVAAEAEAEAKEESRLQFYLFRWALYCRWTLQLRHRSFF